MKQLTNIIIETERLYLRKLQLSDMQALRDILQDYKDKKVYEIGYLFNKSYWHNGYAVESAAACKEYAFQKLKIDEVYSIIRTNNYPSQKVAERNGMTVKDEIVKHYYNIDMSHYVYSIKNPLI